MTIENNEVLAPEDEYAAAFAESVAPEGTPPVDAASATDGGDDAAEAEDEVAGGESAATDGGEQNPPAEEVEGDGSAEAPGESAFAQELAKLREEITKPAEQAAPAPATEPQVPATEAATGFALTDEEQKFLTEYEKDWPEISRAESLKRRKELYEAVQYVFAQVAQVVTPLVDNFKATEYDMHESAIKAIHEDYDTVRPQVIDWVGTQTGTRGKVFSEIVKGGTAEEIADLVTIWKEATGKAKPQVTQGAGSPSAPAEPPAKAKQAAQKLSVVSSKRTAVPAAQDPNDFDSAWSEATGKS